MTHISMLTNVCLVHVTQVCTSKEPLIYCEVISSSRKGSLAHSKKDSLQAIAVTSVCVRILSITTITVSLLWILHMNESRY